jgi:hypothetical protein
MSYGHVHDITQLYISQSSISSKVLATDVSVLPLPLRKLLAAQPQEVCVSI